MPGAIWRSESLKRGFDVLVAVSGLIVLAPLFLVIAIAVRWHSPGAVFFRQIRVGRGGIPFRMIKFRSMVVDAEKRGHQVTAGGDHRITKIGRMLRKWKLDELPQLVNVLSGEMSLVGPRPEVPKYIAYLNEAQREVMLSIRPGITDFAAIEFRDEETHLARAKDPERAYVEEIMPLKYALYERYAHERNFWLDLRLIFATLGKLLPGHRGENTR